MLDNTCIHGVDGSEVLNIYKGYHKWSDSDASWPAADVLLTTVGCSAHSGAGDSLPVVVARCSCQGVMVLMQCHNCASFWCHSADEVFQSQCPCQGVSVWPWSAAAQCIVTPVRGRPPPPSCTPAAPSSRGGELSREWSSATISLSITTTPRRPRPLTVTMMRTRIPSRICPGQRIDTFSHCECGEQSGGNTPGDQGPAGADVTRRG